jgi:ABC-type dipeptide/oligopeptide/nickel transport system permease component
MQRYLLKRVIQSVFVLLGVLFLVFFLLRMTGDPVKLMFSGRLRDVSEEQIQEFRRKMGFDLPLPLQFVNYFSNAFRGDFGKSFRYKVSATDIILERIPATLKLASISLLITLVVSIPLGVMAGVRPGSAWDVIARAIALFSQATPSYWLGLVMISVFAVQLRWFPSSGFETSRHYVMPAIVLSLASVGALIRLTRSTVLEVLQEDYIRTAVSKGLRDDIIYFRHVLRNAALPLVTVIGLSLGSMISGSVYVETIFAWPGMGRLITEAVGLRDFPVIQAMAFLTSLLVVSVTLLTDVVYTLVDPRIRYGE